MVSGALVSERGCDSARSYGAAAAEKGEAVAEWFAAVGEAAVAAVSVEFEKSEHGSEGHLAQFPGMCLCGSQKGPIVDTYMDKPGYGRVYLCRLCTTRAARAFGLVKGEEMTRLEKAADELAQAEKEVADRQALIEKLTKSLADRDQKIQGQTSYIETLTSDVTQMRHLAGLVASTAKEMVAV